MEIEYNHSVQPKLIVFDINHTLIVDNTWQRLNVAMGMTHDEDLDLWGKNQRGELSNDEWVQTVNDIFRSRGHASRSAIESVVFDYQFLDGARETIEALQQRGYTVALLSGAMDILVQKIANDLSIQHYRYCSEFHFDEAGAFDHFTYIDNDATAKVALLKELCDELAIPVDQAICVGDGDNEELIFTMSKGTTFPDSKIATRAWKIINILPELLDVI